MLDKRALIVLLGGLALGLLSSVLKEDVKALVCGAPAAAVAK